MRRNLKEAGGKEYEKVTKNHTAVVYLERMGESSNKDWFCYGKSMEQAYSIYLSSQKTKEAAYLHSMLQVEMSKENLKYVVKAKVAGEENPEAGEYLETEVTYHYDSKRCLIIDLEDEYDNRKVTITEKGE